MAVVNSLNDPLCQHRICISTASMSGVQPSGLPWAKAMNNNSQLSGQNGNSTMTSSHSLKPGDLVLVQRPTGSQQDWMILGHPGTLLGTTSQQGGAGFVNGPLQFIFNLLHIQDSQSTKPKIQQTTVPKDGEPTWTNPTGSQVTQSSQADPRQYFNQMATQYNKPALYQPNIWAKGQNITTSPASGSPITQIIQQLDQTFVREAQGNSNALQMLHRLRMQLNTSDMQNFTPNGQQGFIQTVQGLLMGGGSSGLGNIQGLLSNLFGAFGQMGAATNALGPILNAAIAAAQSLNSSGTPINASGAVLAGASSQFPTTVTQVNGPAAGVPPGMVADA